MESLIRAAFPSLKAVCFLAPHFLLYLLRLGADGADQRLVGNSAACHCAPPPPTLFVSWAA